MPKITNAEFLQTFIKFSKKLDKDHQGSVSWICSKKGDNNNWGGEAYKPDASNVEDPSLNNYFCISRLKPFDGVLARRNLNFFCLMCVVLDDVGTKAKRPDLKPSWRTETSPNNEQWGYILETPITDSAEAENLINLVIKAGYCDKGAGGHVRYMRLPVGSNDKPEHVKNNNGKPYPHNLNSWNPDLHYTKQQLIEGLGLDKFVNHEQQKIKESGIIADVTNRESDEELIKNIITGENYHASARNLAARYIGRGMKEEGIITTIQGFMLTSVTKDQRWKERYDDIPRLVETAAEKFSKNDKELLERFKLTSASDFIKANSISWLVKHILPSGGLAMIYGKSGTGKSFFALDITASISRGISWCGKKVKQGKIVYIAAEGVNGFRRRIQAYSAHHSISPNELAFKIIAETPDLTKDNDKALIASIKEDGGAQVVVIDTLAQVSAGANENSAEDMSMVLRRCQNIQKETGALVLLIHHSGKDDAKGERGWSGMRAAMDTVIKITKKDSHKIAAIEKQKDGDDSFKTNFHLKPFELGFDEDNEVITSCVVDLESDFSSIEEPELKGDIQRIICEILKEHAEKEKEFLIREVIKRGNASGKNRRDSSVRRTLNNMLQSSLLQENQGLIRIAQQHNTSKNSTCADVVKSEVLHNTTSIY